MKRFHTLLFIMLMFGLKTFAQTPTCIPAGYNPDQSKPAYEIHCDLEIKITQIGCDPQGTSISQTLTSILHPVGHGFSSICFYPPRMEQINPGSPRPVYVEVCPESSIQQVQIKKLGIMGETITLTGAQAINFVRVLQGLSPYIMSIGVFYYDCDGELFLFPEQVEFRLPGPFINTYMP